MQNKKADVIIIGAQKAGTTSLNIYLSQHPNIFTHNTQEYGLFRDDESLKKGIQYFYDNTVDDAVKSDTAKTVFVAKRVGLMYDSKRLLQVKEYNPDIKVVVVLRNPVDRAFSAFDYCRGMGIEPYKNFEDAVYINDPSRFNGNEKHKRNCDYIGWSMYAEHIKNIYSIFPAENIHVFLFEEMITDLNAYLNKICSTVDLSGFNFNTSKKHNERKKSRSPFLSKIFSSAKKSLLINILPMKLRLALKKNVKGAILKNSKPAEKKQMAAATHEYLKNIFVSDVTELEENTNLPVKKYWPDFFR